MKSDIIKEGMMVGREHYAKILKRGSKWKNRKIPIFIRRKLMIPFYITESGSDTELWVIKYPEEEDGKVTFSLYATVPYEIAKIHAYPE